MKIGFVHRNVPKVRAYSSNQHNINTIISAYLHSVMGAFRFS